MIIPCPCTIIPISPVNWPIDILKSWRRKKGRKMEGRKQRKGRREERKNKRRKNGQMKVAFELCSVKEIWSYDLLVKLIKIKKWILVKFYFDVLKPQLIDVKLFFKKISWLIFIFRRGNRLKFWCSSNINDSGIFMISWSGWMTSMTQWTRLWPNSRK